jgi:hypothetical protein
MRKLAIAAQAIAVLALSRPRPWAGRIREGVN